MRFKPYPSYKDSGVEWLGEVPEHWDKGLKKLRSKRISYFCEDGEFISKRLNLNKEMVMYPGNVWRRDI